MQDDIQKGKNYQQSWRANRFKKRVVAISELICFLACRRDSVVKGNKYDKAKCTQDEQAGSSLDSLNVAVHPVIE